MRLILHDRDDTVPVARDPLVPAAKPGLGPIDQEIEFLEPSFQEDAGHERVKKLVRDRVQRILDSGELDQVPRKLHDSRLVASLDGFAQSFEDDEIADVRRISRDRVIHLLVENSGA